MYENDNRIILTLDAGGTNFVFSAMKGLQEIASPIVLSACSSSLEDCLRNLKEGFQKVIKQLDEEPNAISFAFPGPADYEKGIIGDLPNFASFRGGVALKDFLEESFNIPVFINNDGNLFAYGEALAGALPKINSILKEKGSNKRFRNLIGITLGTGFGAGVVINQQLLTGDNGTGGDLWLERNSKYNDYIAEESVSIRAVVRVYKELSGEKESKLTPKDIFEIAEGEKSGDKVAAIKSFEELGTVAARGIASALNLIDGLVVIGGGLSGANKYILPALCKELNKSVKTFSGDEFSCTQMKVFNLENREELDLFCKDNSSFVKVPFSEREVCYDGNKRTGITITSIGTSKAIAYGAYTFALNQLDNL